MDVDRETSRTPLVDFTSSGGAPRNHYGALEDSQNDRYSSDRPNGRDPTGNRAAGSRYVAVPLGEGDSDAHQAQDGFDSSAEEFYKTCAAENFRPTGVIKKNPQKPASLTVVGLTYTVTERPGHWWNGNFLRPARPKRVLENLCMTFYKGELTAVVGTSGSGKTSLLDVISGRAEGEVKGVVSYKHEQCTRTMMKRKASYVLQADRLLPTLTVRETLTYMALMKLPGHLTREEIERKVEYVIKEMGLAHVAESRIGGAMVRGVSGGERRRITIGVQLLSDPDILLLDEPTSGLDAFTARHLVSFLADLAHKGDKIVIMSIHQPRSDILYMLDMIAILTGGQLAYQGAPGAMVEYFTNIGHPCPPNENPCDVYMDVCSVDRRTAEKEKETLKKSQRLCNIFSQSELQKNMVESITSSLNFHYNDEPPSSLAWSAWDAPSWWRVFQCLLERMNVHLWRERSAVMGRMIELPAYVPFIVMFTGQVGYSLSSVQDRLGILYQSTQAPVFIGLTNAVARFPSLREVYYRESQDGLYSMITFLSAYFVHVLPFNIFCSCLFASILYWIAGLQEDFVVFGEFVLVCVMLTQFGEMITVAMLGVFRSAQLGSDTTSLLFSASGFLSTGLLRSITNMPKVLEWLGYIAIHKYSTEIVVGNEFHGLEFGCTDDGQPCAETGDSYLDTFYPGALDHMNRNFTLLGGYTVGILIFAVLMFKARGTPTLH